MEMREYLSQHWFTVLEDAQRTLDTWRDYNNARPHCSLANRSPAKYRVSPLKFLRIAFLDHTG